MSYQETLEYLLSLQKFGIKFGLDNTLQLLQFLDNPQTKFKSIHIAGTNGKGSTAVLIASILSEMDFRVGLYTSPHLVRFNERIQVNGKLISDDELIRYTQILRDKIEKIKPTFFEVTTSIAFKYFEDKKVEFAVIETGLGGRLDSTNVILPELSVITSIGYDHQDILGDTIEKITAEKGGIIKKDIPVVIGRNSEQVRNELIKLCKEKQSDSIDVNSMYSIGKLSKSFPIMELEVISQKTKSNYKLISPLYGDFQIDNVATSVASIETLFPYSSNLSKQIENGIRNLHKNFIFNGRFQQISEAPKIIIDTSHNSSAFEGFLKEVNDLDFKNKVAIFGIMKDKKVSDSINLIEKTFKKIITCQARTERALESSKLAARFSETSKIQDGQSVANAIKLAINDIEKVSAIFIFGSNYVVGEAIEYLELWK